MIKEWERREEYLKIIRFKGKGIVPGKVVMPGTIWDKDPHFFEEVKRDSPHVKVTVIRNPEREKENFKRDEWGCLWHYPGGYLSGQVVEHPLEEWSRFKDYIPPDPNKYRDWEKEKEIIEKERQEGRVIIGIVEHGFLYLKLTYLRGFTNFMIDVAERRKELKELIDIITEYWCKVVEKWIKLGVDVIYFGDDLGHQDTLPISPLAWRELIKPSYKKIFSICRANNVEVYFHTDGYIVDIITDLIETGVTILNPQDLVNGLDNLKRLAYGKVCIDLDIDRQKITPFGKPEDIEAHIFHCIKTLGSPYGGLMLIYGAYPGTPKENISAVIKAMEKYYSWWEGRQ